jgi:hypothetical protein
MKFTNSGQFKKGVKKTIEEIEKMRVPHKGSGIYVRSEAHKKAIGDAHRGKLWPKELYPNRCTPHPNQSKYKGENHWSYKKDRSSIKFEIPPWKIPENLEWILAVRKRDGNKCKMENKDCKGRLETHHILPKRDFPELRYVVNNGITLCQAHHPRKRAEEKRLSPYFKELISSKE